MLNSENDGLPIILVNVFRKISLIFIAIKVWVLELLGRFCTLLP